MFLLQGQLSVLTLILVSIPPPHVTTVALLLFHQQCRWLVTVKHASMLRMWLCMKWLEMCYGAWLYGVHRMPQDGSSFEWHQPCKNQTVMQLHHLGEYSKQIMMDKNLWHSLHPSIRWEFWPHNLLFWLIQLHLSQSSSNMNWHR